MQNPSMYNIDDLAKALNIKLQIVSGPALYTLIILQKVASYIAISSQIHLFADDWSID